jgi:hypothetical protein
MTITTSGTNGTSFEFIVGGSTTTYGTAANTVIRLSRPATVEDLERAGFRAHAASVGEMVGAGFVPLDALPDNLRALVKAHFAQLGAA